MTERGRLIMIVAILLILSQPCVQGSPLANGGGKANGLKNFAALNSSTSDHGSNGTYEFSSAYWDSIIPPFGDFPNDTTGRPDLLRPDKDVFQFTEDNIRDSFVQVWFPAWTRERQKDWLWESHGETYLFGMDVLGNGDYFCDISVASCMQQPHVHRILELWPGLENRALAQRIYLLAKMMEVDHHEQRAGLEVLQNAATFLSCHSYQIIRIATLQVDQKKKTACEIIHKVIDLSIQLAASLAAGAASSISNVFTANNSLLKMFASVNMLSGKGLSAMSSTVVNGVVIRTGYKLLDQAQFNWVGTIETQFLTSGADLFTKYLHHTGTISESNNATKTHDVHIDSGVGSDPICSRFEGDTQDLNESNDHNLKQIMADWFDLHLTKEKRTFSKMHKGWVPEPGMPSMRAIYFGERQWPPLYGPHSKNNSLAHSVKFEQAVKVRLLKYFLGHVMSEDDTYLACMHVDDAQKQCSMDPTKQPKPWLTKYRKTMICPKPEDPKLLCQAARWYHTTDYNSHIISVPGIDQIEGWKVGDSQFSVKALLHEAYSCYEMDKNNSVEIDWRSEDLNVPAFHLPVCVNDQLHLHDMNKIPSASESHLQFPFRCGDWRANGSAGFMKAMNLGPGSKIYEGIEGPPGLQHPNALFWNRIPKLLEDRGENISPVSHYLSLCENSIRLPERKDEHGYDPGINRYRPHIGKDEDCAFVKERTSTWNMTEFEANVWFCENVGNHTVWQRQNKDYVLPESLTAKQAHHNKCKEWIKKAKKRLDNEEKKSKEEKGK